MDLAFKAFFQGVKAGWDDPGYPRSGFHINDAGAHLDASNIGNIPIDLHRPIESNIKTLTVRRSSTGKWYACFSVEYEPSPAREKDTTLGVDPGIESVATLSNGEKIENLWSFRTDKKALSKAQRRPSKTEKRTPDGKNPERLLQESTNGSRTVGSIQSAGSSSSSAAVPGMERPQKTAVRFSRLRRARRSRPGTHGTLYGRRPGWMMIVAVPKVSAASNVRFMTFFDMRPERRDSPRGRAGRVDDRRDDNHGNSREVPRGTSLPV